MRAVSKYLKFGQKVTLIEYAEEKEILCILFLPIKSVLDTEIRYNRENSTHPV